MILIRERESISKFDADFICKNIQRIRLIGIVRGQVGAGAYDCHWKCLQFVAICYCVPKKNWHINKQFNSKMDRYCDIFQLENLFHGNLDHVYKKQDLVTMHKTVCVCVWNSKNESFSVCFLFYFVESCESTWEHRMCLSVLRFSFVARNSQSENQI